MKALFRSLCIFSIFFLLGASSIGADFRQTKSVSVKYIHYQSDSELATLDNPFINKLSWRSTFREGTIKGKFDISVIGQSMSSPYLIVEEAWFSYSKNTWQLSAGSQLFDWSVFDVFKVSDVINRIHLATWVSDSVESPDKYGELSLSIEKTFDTSKLELHVFPLLFDTPFPTVNNRMNVLHSSFNDNVFLSSDGNNLQSGDVFFQWAIRNNYILGSTEVSLYALRQYDKRYPLFDIKKNASITPVYFPMYQYGITYRQLWNDFQLKFEAAYRDFDAINVQISNGLDLVVQSQVDHLPVALGIEHSQSYANGSESIFSLEFQQIYGTAYEERMTLDVFQKDLFFGYTYLFNNINDMKIELGVLMDLEGSDQWMERLILSSRLTDRMRLRFGGILFQAKSGTGIPKGLEVLKDNSQLFAEFKYYF